MKIKNLLFAIGMMLYAFNNLYAEKPSRDTTFKGNLIDGIAPPSFFYIKKGNEVRFRIDDINRNLYDITVNNEYKSLHTTQPVLFNALTELDVSKLNALLQSETTTGDSSLKEIGLQFENKELKSLLPAKREYYEKRKALVDAIDLYSKSYKSIRRLNRTYNDLLDLSLNSTSKYPEIKQAKIDLTEKLLEEEFGITPSETDVGLGLTLKNNTEALFEELEEKHKEITQYYIDYQSLKAKYEQLLTAELSKVKKGKNTITEEIMEELSGSTIFHKTLEQAIANVEKAKTKIDALEAAAFSSQLKKAYDRINVSAFSYVSPAFLAKEDLMEITWRINPKPETKDYMNHYANFNKTLTGHVTGFKINFSTGIFGILGKDVFDQSYKLQAIEGDTVNNMIIKNKNKTCILPAIGALMHFYYQGKTNFNLGGALGISVNNETNLNYHGGLSALFGQEQRIIISAGATLAKVQLLSNDYEENELIPKTITTVPLNDFYRWGGFVSITYNLSKK